MNTVDRPHNPITGTVYSGRNLDTLSSYDCKEWATFLQWHQAGYKVKKGELGTKIHYFTEETRKNKKTGKLETVGGARTYTVFNATQVEKKGENDV